MELVRQPHPKRVLLSVWHDGMWESVNFKATSRPTEAIQFGLTEGGYGRFAVADIERAVADESCDRWHELVTALSEHDREVLGRCVE